jgi:hypothetical protein
VERIRRRGGKREGEEKKEKGKGKKKKERRKKRKNKRRGEKRKNKRRGEKRKKIISTFYNLNPTEAVLPSVFQNGSNSTREATPPAEPEPEPFLEEPKPCQTGP